MCVTACDLRGPRPPLVSFQVPSGVRLVVCISNGGVRLVALGKWGGGFDRSRKFNVVCRVLRNCVARRKLPVGEGEWVRVSWRSDGLEGGEVCGEAVQGSFVVFSNFV